MRTRAIPVSASRVVAAVALLSFLALGAFMLVSLDVAEDAVREQVEQRMAGRAGLGQQMVARDVDALVELVESYGHRPSLAVALRAGGPDTRSVVGTHVSQLRHHRPGIRAVAVIDAMGDVIHVPSGGDAQAAREAAWQARAEEGSAVGHSYVSGALGLSTTRRPVVVVAAPIRSAAERDDRAAGTLVVAYDAATIEEAARAALPSRGTAITVRDRAGAAFWGADEPGARAAQAREDALSATAEVPGLGWTVTVQQPREAAFASVARVHDTQINLAALLAVGLLTLFACAYTGARRRDAAEERARVAAVQAGEVLDAASEAFVATNDDGIILEWNAAAERMFGWAAHEVLGRGALDVLLPAEQHAAHLARVAPLVELARGGGSHRVEFDAVHRDGRGFPVETTFWPATTSVGTRWNAFIRDIGARRAAEEELRKLSRDATKASRLKSEFVATMSHEIRTPMNGVIGMTGLLLDSELTAEQRECAEVIRTSGQALLSLIDDILDFSKIEAGKLDLEVVDFDLRAAVEDVADLFAESASRNRVELVTLVDPGAPSHVRADPGRLRQILMNLVGNAVKFTEHGDVVVRVGVEEEGEADVLLRFEVADTGIGIAVDRQGALFDPFIQEDASTTRRYGGSGLGLAISKQLAELLGGGIGVHSEPGHGSTFWFTARVATVPLHARPAQAQTLNGQRVLVVDDHALITQVLVNTLRGCGARPSPAGHDEAVALLVTAADSGDAFHALLLDDTMPGSDTLALVSTMRTIPALSHTKIVLLTSSTSRAYVREARAAGVDAFLSKPVRQSSLVDCLRTVGELEHTSARAGRRATSPRRGVRVLVVEDNLVNQRVAVRMLEKLGYDADLAANGGEALDAVKRRAYAAVLMDCQMPEMDGYEATRAIRALGDARAHVPILAMTAGATGDDVARCRAAGMDDHVSKPVSLERLQSALEGWIAATGAIRAEEPDVDEDDARIDPAMLAGLRTVDGEGDDVAADIVKMFVVQAAEQMGLLRTASATADGARVSALAHSLKGSAAMVGAAGLADACRELERAADDGDFVTASSVLTRLEHALAHFEAAVPQLLAAT